VGGGTPQEREAAAQLFADADSRFVIDAATLAELATIECLEYLAGLSQVLVSTRTQDLIAQKLADVRVTRREGTAFQRDGQLGFSEFSDQDRAREIRYFEAIAGAIERHCEVLPAYGPDDISQVPAELRRVISSEEFSVVLLSMQENASLLSIDGRLRNIASMFGISGVWPQMVLMHALSKQEISGRDYSVACLKMFFANRSFISLGAFDLTMMAYQGEDWLDFGIRKFAKLIAEGEMEFDSALRVSMEFLGMLFRFGNCQFGVIGQLLGILVASLRRHKHSVKDLKLQVTELLTRSLGSFGTDHPDYIRRVVALTFAADVDAKSTLPLRVKVLKIASPPLVHVRKELPGVESTDNEISSSAESGTAQPGDSSGTGTSAAPDAPSEQI